MAPKRLDNVSMGDTWTSYIAAAYGALRASGLWTEDISTLMGMSGIGFHFIVHEQACASSATVYDWQNGHLAAMDRIGVRSRPYLYWNGPGMNTMDFIKEEAVAEIKSSINRGIPVVLWAPTDIMEFGIIDGYDDGDGVLYVRSCVDPDSDPLLYDNLGCSEVPILFYQIFKGRMEVDREKIFRDSLTFAVGEWEKSFHTSPMYASGLKAYDNLLATLKKGDYQEFGLTYLTAVYADAKAHIAKFLRKMADETSQLDGIGESADEYGRVAEAFQRIAELIPFRGPASKRKSGGIIERQSVPEVLNLVREAKVYETKAMAIIKEALY